MQFDVIRGSSSRRPRTFIRRATRTGGIFWFRSRSPSTPGITIVTPVATRMTMTRSAWKAPVGIQRTTAGITVITPPAPTRMTMTRSAWKAPAGKQRSTAGITVPSITLFEMVIFQTIKPTVIPTSEQDFAPSLALPILSSDSGSGADVATLITVIVGDTGSGIETATSIVELVFLIGSSLWIFDPTGTLGMYMPITSGPVGGDPTLSSLWRFLPVGKLTYPIPVVPPPSPEIIFVTVRVTGSPGDTTLAVQPIATPLAAGTPLYLGASLVATLIVSAPYGSNLLNVLPLPSTLVATTVLSGTPTISPPPGPPAPPPPGSRTTHLQRVAIELPVPALNSKGQPV